MVNFKRSKIEGLGWIPPVEGKSPKHGKVWRRAGKVPPRTTLCSRMAHRASPCAPHETSSLAHVPFMQS
eukprot:6456891-Amphidinium_carterae.1